MTTFRPMRRSRQLLSENETIAILERGTHGVLAVLGDEGYPYTVPLSYLYADGKLYFHGANVGHKLDALAACGKASFCVVDQDQVIPEEYTTYFRSAVCFGQARLVEDKEEALRIVALIAAHYRPGFEVERARAIANESKTLGVIEFTIEHMTGKEAIELVRARKND